MSGIVVKKNGHFLDAHNLSVIKVLSQWIRDHFKFAIPSMDLVTPAVKDRFAIQKNDQPVIYMFDVDPIFFFHFLWVLVVFFIYRHEIRIYFKPASWFISLEDVILINVYGWVNHVIKEKKRGCNREVRVHKHTVTVSWVLRAKCFNFNDKFPGEGGIWVSKLRRSWLRVSSLQRFPADLFFLLPGQLIIPYMLFARSQAFFLPAVFDYSHS